MSESDTKDDEPSSDDGGTDTGDIGEEPPDEETEPEEPKDNLEESENGSEADEGKDNSQDDSFETGDSGEETKEESDLENNGGDTEEKDLNGEETDSEITEKDELGEKIENPETDIVTADSDGIASGSVQEITWKIDADGNLVVEGTGDFHYDREESPSAPWNKYSQKITSAEVNVTGMTNVYYMFSDCNNLINVDLSGFDASKVTSTYNNMFNNCSNISVIRTPINLTQSFELQLLKTPGYIWCRSDGTEITELPQNLNYSIEITKKPLISDGDAITGSYKNIIWSIDSDLKLTVEGTGDFSDSDDVSRAPWYNYRKDINSAEINASNMTDASYMFEGCSNLTNIDFSGFDTSTITNMSGMFENACLESLDLSNFNTSNVTDMSGMFFGMFGLENLDLSNFDTSSVTDMSDMFRFSGFCSVNLSSFDTSNVTDMSHMLEGSHIKSIDLSNFDFSNVTNMFRIFYTFDLSVINTPPNLTQSVALPTFDAECWYNPDGEKITELPQNLSYSIK